MWHVCSTHPHTRVAIEIYKQRLTASQLATMQRACEHDGTQIRVLASLPSCMLRIHHSGVFLHASCHPCRHRARCAASMFASISSTCAQHVTTTATANLPTTPHAQGTAVLCVAPGQHLQVLAVQTRTLPSSRYWMHYTGHAVHRMRILSCTSRVTQRSHSCLEDVRDVEEDRPHEQISHERL
jgi:hypothetical protein